MLPLLLIAILLVALGISWLCVYLVHLGETVPAVRRFSDLAVPLLFGVMLIAEWELVTRGFGVPEILLPAPSVILRAAANALPTLCLDRARDHPDHADEGRGLSLAARGDERRHLCARPAA